MGTVKGTKARKVVLGLVALLLFGVLAVGAGADASSAAPAATLASDSSTYAPGDAVTLSGANWTGGQLVHLHVAAGGDDAWSRDVDILAAADGTISDSFELPSGLGADFGAVATGPLGESATTSFTSAFAAPAAPPTIVSDKVDYSPGATVTLTGANWQPGEAVHINVNDDDSQSWTHNADVTADADGNLSYSFALPTYFVAQYSVKATGALSGTATTTFTDGNVTLHLPAGQGATSITVTYEIFGSAGGGGTVDNTCTGPPPSSSGTMIVPSGGTANVPGFGNNNLSVRLGVVTSTPAGKTIDYWAAGDKNNEFVPEQDLGAGPCISANTSAGTNGNVGDLYAHLKSVNTAPTANAQSVTTDEDTAKTITLSGSDADGNSLTFSVVSGPANGTLGAIGTVSCTGTAPKSCSADVTYTPNANFNAADSFTFKVNDGAADSAAATVSIGLTAVNDAPTAGTVLLSPSSATEPRTAQTLTATPAGFADPDGDTLSYSYVWKRNGVVIAGETGSTLDLSQPENGDKGDTILVEVKASDGNTESGAATDSTTVKNTAPTAGTVAVSPGSPTTNQTLTATPSGFADADGDSLTYHYQWYKNGSALAGETSSTLDLSQAGTGGKGDLIKIEAYASDGAASSGTSDDMVTVANSAPTAGTGAVSPGSPTTDQTLTVTPAGFSDDDGDTLTYHYQWFKNGSALAGETSSTLDLSQAGNGDKGDELKVEVYASDGDASSGTAEDAVTVVNTAPTATVTLDAASLKTTDVLAATATTSDADADAVTLTYVWKVNGTTVKTTAGTSSLSDTLDLSVAGNGDKGDTIRVELTPNDGEADGATVDDTATVVNSAPVLASPGNKTVAEGTLLAFSLAATDADNDPLTFAMSGHKTGGDDAMSLTSGGAFSWTPGDNYSTFGVTFTAADGTASDSKTIDIDSTNVNPTASNLSLTHNPVTGVVTVSLGYEDAGWHDTHTATFDWTIDGVNSSNTVNGVGADMATTPPAESGTASKTRTLTPGCHTVAVSAYVQDDNAGQSSTLNTGTSAIDVYTVGFGPPIMQNERNIAKYGNVVPVKVKLTSCSGGAVTSASLFLSYVQGTGTDISGTEAIAESVSAADGTGGQMRTADGMYIYNFTTKPLTANRDYTLRVKLGSQSGPIVAEAVLQPKK